MEQAFVMILDPTSPIFKNVTPYCIRFVEIQNHFRSRLQILDEISECVYEKVRNMGIEVEDCAIEVEFQEQFKARLGMEGSFISRLFAFHDLTTIQD